MVEDRLVGIKSREIYEAPGAMVLITAHTELEHVTLERDLARFKRAVDQRWAELVYDGLWYLAAEARAGRPSSTSPSSTSPATSGWCCTAGTSPSTAGARGSLYDFNLATYDEGDTFDQSSAKGFVHPARAAVASIAARRCKPPGIAADAESGRQTSTEQTDRRRCAVGRAVRRRPGRALAR